MQELCRTRHFAFPLGVRSWQLARHGGVRWEGSSGLQSAMVRREKDALLMEKQTIKQQARRAALDAQATGALNAQSVNEGSNPRHPGARRDP